MRSAVIIEKTGTGYGAHVPDLPGCIAAGSTYEEIVQLIQEAIRSILKVCACTVKVSRSP